MGLARKPSKSNGSSRKPRTARKPPLAFVLCLRNEGCDDLDLHKVYRHVADPEAEARGLVRVVDESGEDYLYPAEYFAPLELPQAVADELTRTV